MQRAIHRRTLLVFGLITSVFVLTISCGGEGTSTVVPSTPTPACQSEAAAYLAEIRPLIDEFRDTVEVADSTARIALSAVVQDMQEIRRDLADVTSPDCAEHGRALLMDGLGNVIDAYLAFMRDESEACVAIRMRQGADQLSTALDELSALSEGRPTPTAPSQPTPTQEWNGVCVGMSEREVNGAWYQTKDGRLPSPYIDEDGSEVSSSFALEGKRSAWVYEDVVLVMENPCQAGLMSCWYVLEIRPR